MTNSKFKAYPYLQQRALHAQHLHGVRVGQDLQGVRGFRDSFNLLVDLSQDLIEKDVFDVHSEEPSERTLFGWLKSQGMLNFLNEPGSQTGMVVTCIRKMATEI